LDGGNKTQHQLLIERMLGYASLTQPTITTITTITGINKL